MSVASEMLIAVVPLPPHQGHHSLHCGACRSPASVAPRPSLSLSRSPASPGFDPCKLLRNPAGLALGFPCQGVVLRGISSGASQRLEILYCGAAGSRGGACLPFFLPNFLEGQMVNEMILSVESSRTALCCESAEVYHECIVSLGCFLKVFTANKTEVICVLNGDDACFSTRKTLDARLAAGVLPDCTLPPSLTDGQPHDIDHQHCFESAGSALSLLPDSSELIAGATVVDEDAFAESSVEDVNFSALHSLENANPVQYDSSRKQYGEQKRPDVVEELRSGGSLSDILASMTDWSPPAIWALVDSLQAHGRMVEALEVFKRWKLQDEYRPCELHYTKFIRMLGKAHMPTEARILFSEMCGLGLRPSVVTYTCLLQSFAERGHFEEAELILRDMVLSGDATPNTVTYSGLIHAYGKRGMYDNMWRTFNRMKTQHIPADEFTYRTLIKAYARGGLLNRMHLTMKEMSRNGMCADSVTMNAVVLAYTEAGMVKEMEKHYEVLSKYSLVASQKTIKAMVWTYVENSLFFQLSGFVRRVGLHRRTMGNYLWNALLLSRAANFAMDDLKAEFENMKHSGFYPDVTTCNILALAYSRTKQFRDLHELIFTMQNNGIAPDLVTYGAVIDVFIEEKMRPSLLEELVEFRNLDLVAEVETDLLVIEVFGKGRFHVACESLTRNVEGQAMDQRMYSELIGFFLQSLRKRRYSRR